MKSDEAVLGQLPKCDICKLFGRRVINDANVDSATIAGTWAFTCEDHRRWRVPGTITWLKAEACCSS
jgi:hypothetical protein